MSISLFRQDIIIVRYVRRSYPSTKKAFLNIADGSSKASMAIALETIKKIPYRNNMPIFDAASRT